MSTINTVITELLNDNNDLMLFIQKTAITSRVKMDKEFTELTTAALTAFKDFYADSDAYKIAESINNKDTLVITPEWEPTTLTKEHVLTWAIDKGLLDQHEIDNTDNYTDQYGNTPYEAVKDYIMENTVKQYATWL